MKIFPISLVGCGIVSAAADEAIDLTGDGFAAWREPAGAWSTAGGVALCPTNSARLAPLPGEGIPMNGPDGRTVSLQTCAKFGGVGLHVGFMSPARSNSSADLMGRHKLQIFDSHIADQPRHPDVAHNGVAIHRDAELSGPTRVAAFADDTDRPADAAGRSRPDRPPEPPPPSAAGALSRRG